MQQEIKGFLKALEIDIDNVKKAELRNKKLVVSFVDGHKAEFNIYSNYSLKK